jgi:5-hydroxyisourate hydrolase
VSAGPGTITTHVLDTARGRPAAGVPVRLERAAGDGWELVGAGTTGGDGRARDLLPAGTPAAAGTWRLTFDTAAYLGAGGFWPRVSVTFTVRDAAEHHHVPLLLSPYGYSTYRGS